MSVFRFCDKCKYKVCSIFKKTYTKCFNNSSTKILKPILLPTGHILYNLNATLCFGVLFKLVILFRLALLNVTLLTNYHKTVILLYYKLYIPLLYIFVIADVFLYSNHEMLYGNFVNYQFTIIYAKKRKNKKCIIFHVTIV